MDSGIGLGVSLALVALLVLGSLWFIIYLDLFWMGFALWATFIAFLPAREHRNARYLLTWRLLALIALPFILETLGIAVGIHPLGITTSFAWIIGSIAVFVLCMTTMIFIDVRGEMRMSGLFFTTVTFLFFESVLVIQGWMSWYSDLYLGTDLVPTEHDFMVYYVLSTAMGLALAVLLSIYLRRRSYDGFKERVAGVEGG